jgi:hypothetical protein
VLGLAIVGMVFAHLLLSWSWIASQSRRWFAVSARARINYILNLSLLRGVRDDFRNWLITAA